MSNDNKEEMLLGQEAEKLLGNTMLKNWFMLSRASMFEEFTASMPDDDDLRRLIHSKMGLLAELERSLHEFSDSGKMAAQSLEEFREQMRKR
jgi:hypothetical protein